MTVRAYGTTARPSRLNTPHFTKTDLGAVIFTFCYVAAVIFVEVI